MNLYWFILLIKSYNIKSEISSGLSAASLGKIDNFLNTVITVISAKVLILYSVEVAVTLNLPLAFMSAIKLPFGQSYHLLLAKLSAQLRCHDPTHLNQKLEFLMLSRAIFTSFGEITNVVSFGRFNYSDIAENAYFSQSSSNSYFLS
jgi:hypothetical protein